jgi:hypothetical protein
MADFLVVMEGALDRLMYFQMVLPVTTLLVDHEGVVVEVAALFLEAAALVAVVVVVVVAPARVTPVTPVMLDLLDHLRLTIAKRLPPALHIL